jgi:hypothetical protein
MNPILLRNDIFITTTSKTQSRGLWSGDCTTTNVEQGLSVQRTSPKPQESAENLLRLQTQLLQVEIDTAAA